MIAMVLVMGMMVGIVIGDGDGDRVIVFVMAGDGNLEKATRRLMMAVCHAAPPWGMVEIIMRMEMGMRIIFRGM